MDAHHLRLPSSWLLFLLATSLVVSTTAMTCSVDASSKDRKVYIVYMGAHSERVSAVGSLHKHMLRRVVGRDEPKLLIRSYTRSINGFVAKLTDREAKKMAGLRGVVSVFPSRKRELHTTRSWSFMGFPEDVSRATYESDIIIGVLDTGIWPESESFSEKGIGPPPSKWKGKCASSANFTCNNKIIGAQYYHSENSLPLRAIDSPRDTEGHGSHTSSTAAGRLAVGASLYGLAEGTARGAVPSARIAAYKICWDDGCYDSDILAAFDDAIADGVDVISLSVGGSYPFDYFDDSIAIGAFHAMKNGILTSNSAGNSGPGPGSVCNYSPWSLTVAASSIDRRFVADLKLGNGNAYDGVSVNTFALNDTMYPLVYGGNVPNTSAGYDSSTSRYCYEGSLDVDLVKGTIVLCDIDSDGSGPLVAGAVGTVMQTDVATDYAFTYPLSAVVLGSQNAAEVSLYINTTSKPAGITMKGKGIDDPLAPTVVSFSSRGPNPITADILKPDLTAPGVDILAGWSPVASVSGYEGDKREVLYNIISGTSMSCPHASGAAAYVKSFHSIWSPAAIKSALMTTAYPMNASKNMDAEFAYGAGHINPVAALNPGLVYDAGEADYIGMLCGQGYSTKLLRLVTGDSNTCSSSNNGTVWDLNYPSFALSVQSGKSFSNSFKRTVTNVGSATSTYKATIKNSSGLKISVEPSTISFKSLLEKQSYVLKIGGETMEAIVSASVVWDDDVHSVRSPIIVYTDGNQAINVPSMSEYI